MPTEENQVEIKTAKLLTSQKITDRTLLTKIYEPEKPEEKKAGLCYFLIEILSPWFPASEVAQTIIDTVIKEYYQNKKISETIQRFEEALKKTNQKLAKLATKEKADWLGKLNAICAVIQGNSLHLASTGTAEAYLFREKSSSHITEETKSNVPPHPLTTFGTIISGDLKTGDKIFLTNQEIFQSIPLEEIKDILNNTHYKEALQKIAKTLKQNQIKTVNALILETFPAETIEDENLANLPEMIFLDQAELGWLEKTLKTKPRPEETITQQIPKNKFRTQIKNIIISVGKFTILLFRALRNNLKALRKSRRELAKEKLAQKKEFLEQETTPLKPRKSIISQFFSGIFIFLKNILEFFINLIRPEHRRLFYFILTIVILGGLILGISILKKNQNAKYAAIKAKEGLILAEKKEKEGKVSLALAKKDEARKLFQEGLELTKAAHQFPHLREEAKRIENLLQSDLDQIDNITRLKELKPIISFEDNRNGPTQIYLSEKIIYALSPNSSKLEIFSLDTQKIEKPISIPKSLGKMKFGLVDSDNLLFYTEERKVISLDLGSAEFSTKMTQNNEIFAESSAGDIYSTNLYLLNVKDGQIVKYLRSGQNFSQAKNYFLEKQDLSLAISLAIDGDIYVLESNGNLKKYTAGILDPNFKIKNVPQTEAIKKARKVFTIPTLNYIYILDQEGRKILEIDKNGEYSRTIIFPELDNLLDFQINQKTKKLYLLNKNQLFEVNL